MHPVKAATRFAAVALAAALALTVARGEEPPADAPVYSTGSWGDVPWRDLSPLARQAVGDPNVDWTYAWNEDVVVHARDPNRIDAVVREATFATSYVGHVLKLPPPAAPARIILVDDLATWGRLSRSKGLRPDGLAVHAGGDILLLAATGMVERADRIAHELVHFRLHAAGCAKGPALWADEGLAGLFGIRAARAFRLAQSRKLTGEWPAIPDADLLPFGDLLAAESYPADPAIARAFYRQSLEFVAWLVERIDEADVPTLARTLCEGGSWRDALRSVYPDAQLPTEPHVAEMVRRRSAQPLVF